ncbi:carbon-nitrogen hydrolase family protein [Sphingomonas changnyeongensis]|uniref:Carbon-nitrogen hydrolase family protein n=1 Tax=Sphingomonas changnyeongensis TaxID=2698679 RepID=A0A7Z2NX24_9SPHN|nr:carbon-nitrogen hydrolase family protein [Sphingomonas changnyeongensis]QHL90999.1 carbon-nitrogen hydrolase family protein [Sphingomonas changnyeongensis]
MRVALLQMTAGIDPADNARTIADAVAAAKAGGAAMLFTPEMSNLIDRDRERSGTVLTREADDPTLAAVRAAAREAGIWVHLGSLALAGDGADARRRNRGFVIDGSGAIAARYDKIHLFDVDLPGGESWRESAVYAPGDRAVAVDAPPGRLGLSICYDLRFPDLYRGLADAGATLLAVPAAFTVPTGRAHWHVMLRARAIEAGAFVIAAAQTGTHADGRMTFGHSLVVDPWGEVLLDMGDAPGLGFAEIDAARLADVRARIPVLAHRRAIPPVELAR